MDLNIKKANVGSVDKSKRWISAWKFNAHQLVFAIQFTNLFMGHNPAAWEAWESTEFSKDKYNYRAPHFQEADATFSRGLCLQVCALYHHVD